MQPKRIFIAIWKIIFSIGCISCSCAVYSQSLSQPLPNVYYPGIVKIEDGTVKTIELPQDRPFIATGDFPWTEIKGNRRSGKTRSLLCLPEGKSAACMIDTTVDGQREYWLFRPALTGPGRLKKIPAEASRDDFFEAAISILSANMPLSFVAFPNKISPAKLWVETSAPEKPFASYSLSKLDETAIVRPVAKGKKIKALFSILPTKSFIRSADNIAFIVFGEDGNFYRSRVPDDCEILGSVSDKILCAPLTRPAVPTRDTNIAALPYLRLKPPGDAMIDTGRDAGRYPIHFIDDGVVLSAFSQGISRPYLQNMNETIARPMLPASQSCIAGDTHADVVGIAADYKAVMLRIAGPLTPQKFLLAPFSNGQILACSPDVRILSIQLMAAAVPPEAKIRHIPAQGDLPPYALITGNSKGPLEKHILLISYGVYAIWNPEGYLGPWIDQWLAKGGSIAYVHLPGGGGYGADWAKAGYGINGKIESVKMLDRLGTHLIDSGITAPGKIALLAESSGGPVAANAVLLNPKKYSVLALRAACIDIEGGSELGCPLGIEFGDFANFDDRAKIYGFNVTTRLAKMVGGPMIMLGLPEFDANIPRDYQLRMVDALPKERRVIVPLTGLTHTERGSEALERQWIDAIINSVVNRNGN